MNETIRFLIHVDSDWKVTVTCDTLDKSWRHERSMRHLPVAADAVKGQFPLPPQEDLPLPGEPHYSLCTSTDVDSLSKAYQQIIARVPDKEGVERFGRYLFHSLIGPQIWKSILNASDKSGVKVIELALSWRKVEHYLHRLNWEMMCGPDGFLARGYPKIVAVTRLVTLEPDQAPPVVRQIQPPPRVLFVIGAPLTDPHIRPGAEYYSLLRQLHSKKVKRSIHSFLIQGTTPDRGASPQQLKAAMESFHPDVVHFICHGNFDAKNGRGYLLLELDRNETDRERYAEQLLGYLRAGGECPPIVVLSACYSGASANAGAMLRTEHAAPLAAELVAGGVPVVIGMAGRISDRACRSFTRGFGESLVGGEALVTATAKGRLAAFAEGPLPDRCVDWALPSVFMARSMTPGYVPVKMMETDPACIMEDRISAYYLLREPVFCGREEFFQAYYELLSKREKEQPVLLILSMVDTRGLGRKRLLHELVAQAIRDGNIPVLLSPPSPGEPLPTTVSLFGLAMLKSIRDACRVFGLEPPQKSDILDMMQWNVGKSESETRDNMREHFKDRPDLLFVKIMEHLLELLKDNKDLLKKEELKLGLQHDLAWLIQTARNKYPLGNEAAYPPVTKDNRVVVFLERVDQYGEDLLSTLLFDLLGGVGSVGLGTTDEPVPVVITADLTKTSAQIIQQIEEKLPGWIRRMDLKPFQENGEDMLAYERVLLYPSEHRFNLFPGISNVPWAVNDKAPKDTEEACQVFFRTALQGIPVLFAEGSAIFGMANGARKLGYLVEANDEQVLRELLNKLET